MKRLGIVLSLCFSISAFADCLKVNAFNLNADPSGIQVWTDGPSILVKNNLSTQLLLARALNDPKVKLCIDGAVQDSPARVFSAIGLSAN